MFLSGRELLRLFEPKNLRVCLFFAPRSHVDVIFLRGGMGEQAGVHLERPCSSVVVLSCNCFARKIQNPCPSFLSKRRIFQFWIFSFGSRPLEPSRIRRLPAFTYFPMEAFGCHAHVSCFMFLLASHLNAPLRRKIKLCKFTYNFISYTDF